MATARGRVQAAHGSRDRHFPPELTVTEAMWPIGRIATHAGACGDTGRQRGFSLLELVMTLAIAVTIAGIALANLQNSVKHSKADGGLEQAAAALQSARELSISQRRNMELEFLGTNAIQIIRVEVPGPGTTALRTIQLEGQVEFTLTAGVPDTPDLFGNAAAVALGAAVPAMFTTDGSFIDANGDVLNGTLFLGVPGDPLSARAISIFGPTGAMRLWEWNGETWTEQ